MNQTTVEGHYGNAIVYNPTVEAAAIEQIRGLLDTKLAEQAHVRIMPDVHAGAGCVIGTTMNITDKVCPNLVGVDIGCGVLAVRLGNTAIDLVKLDRFIRKQIPSGFDLRKEPHEFHFGKHIEDVKIESLRCFEAAGINAHKSYLSVGTLGGGNHFIEVATDECQNKWLIVHSGSRNTGLRVAIHYQKLAEQTCEDNVHDDLKYLTGQHMEDYLYDMQLMQRFATLNRMAIVDAIFKQFGEYWSTWHFETVHNYIEPYTLTLRKGAVSSKAGEFFIVPLNMADGSLICEGKGNPEWNYSAPHGAGRVLSRTQAKKTLDMGEFEKRMDGIYSTSVREETLDESPMAYKDGSDIERLLEPTATIINRLKPIYSFKACSRSRR